MCFDIKFKPSILNRDRRIYKVMAIARDVTTKEIRDIVSKLIKHEAWHAHCEDFLSSEDCPKRRLVFKTFLKFLMTLKKEIGVLRVFTCLA